MIEDFEKKCYNVRVGFVWQVCRKSAEAAIETPKKQNRGRYNVRVGCNVKINIKCSIGRRMIFEAV